MPTSISLNFCNYQKHFEAAITTIFQKVKKNVLKMNEKLKFSRKPR